MTLLRRSPGDRFGGFLVLVTSVVSGVILIIGLLHATNGQINMGTFGVIGPSGAPIKVPALVWGVLGLIAVASAAHRGALLALSSTRSDGHSLKVRNGFRVFVLQIDEDSESIKVDLRLEKRSAWRFVGLGLRWFPLNESKRWVPRVDVGGRQTRLVALERDSEPEVVRLLGLIGLAKFLSGTHVPPRE